MHQDLNQIRYPVMPFAPHGSDTPARGDEHGGMYIGTINDCQLPPDGIGPGPHAGVRVGSGPGASGLDVDCCVLFQLGF